MRGRYDTNDTPVQVLVKQTKELATNLEDVEREKVFLQEIISNLKLTSYINLLFIALLYSFYY